MKAYWIGACTLLTMGLAGNALAEPAGTLLFAQQGTQIVGENGATRAAAKGDVLQTGERLVTPAGSISQVVLSDGSLIGVRPESELRLDRATVGADNRAPVVSLVQGTVRVIGAELMDPRKTSSITLQSGATTVQLKGGDLESAVVRGDGKPAASGAAPGSYQRLLVGSGSVANGNAIGALTPRQVNFASTGNAGPATLSNPAQTPFAPNRVAGPANMPGNPKGPAPINPGNIANPLNNAPGFKQPGPLNMPVAPVIAPVNRPCTRFIGKTCIQ